MLGNNGLNMRIKLFILNIFLLNLLVISASSGQDTEAPQPKWSMSCKGTVFGTVTEMPDDDGIRSNLQELKGVVLNNYIFEHGDYIPGETRTTNFKLTASNPNQDAYAEILFSDAAGNDTTIYIDYVALKLKIEPPFHNFGNVPKGEFREQEFIITNISDRGIAKIKNYDLKPGSNDFTFVTNPQTDLVPGASIKCTIRFDAVSEGVYRDSIGAGDTCVTLYRSLIEAKVGIPLITVTDINFTDTDVGNSETKDFFITNPGNTELLITGFTGPADNNTFELIFPAHIPDISPTQPLRLGPGMTDSLSVKFSPGLGGSYLDSIVFISDAEKADKTCILKGRGIAPEIFITPLINWGRKRIDRTPDFPVMPYDGEILIVNTSNKDFTINSIDSTNSILSYDFKFQRSAFENLVVLKGDSARVKVQFFPKEYGEHELVIVYDNQDNLDLRTTLEGIGTVPKINKKDADFGNTSIFDYANSKSSEIVFTNEAWKYADSLTIFDLISYPSGNEIASDGISWGTEGFRFNKSGISLPVKLAPGESMRFNAEFVAVRNGIHSADLFSVSDAIDDSASVLTGMGTATDLRVISDSAEVCRDGKDTLILSYRNNGVGNIKIDSIRIEPPMPEFSFILPADADGFDLVKGEIREVYIEFDPAMAAGLYETKVFSYYNSPDSPIIRNIAGNALFISKNTSSQLNRTLVSYGDTLEFSISLDFGQNLLPALIDTLTMQLEFRNDFLAYIENSIELDNSFKNDLEITYTSVKNSDPGSHLTTITVSMRMINGSYFYGTGRLMGLKMLTFLPWYGENEKDSNNYKMDYTDFNYTVTAPFNNCVEFLPRGSRVNLDRVCVDSLRRLVISGYNYELMDIKPNPANSDFITIDFKLGLDADTELRIYNSFGIESETVIDKYLNAGEYINRINLTDYSSGVYFIVLRSGPYFETKRFIISK